MLLQKYFENTNALIILKHGLLFILFGITAHMESGLATSKITGCVSAYGWVQGNFRGTHTTAKQMST